jgi:hypothetical protein
LTWFESAYKRVSRAEWDADMGFFRVQLECGHATEASEGYLSGRIICLECARKATQPNMVEACDTG